MNGGAVALMASTDTEPVASCRLSYPWIGSVGAGSREPVARRVEMLADVYPGWCRSSMVTSGISDSQPISSVLHPPRVGVCIQVIQLPSIRSEDASSFGEWHHVYK
jgi:hypothetical protein